MTWTEPTTPLGRGLANDPARSHARASVGVPAVLERTGLRQTRARAIPNRMDPGLRLAPSPARRAPRPATKVERQQRLPLIDEWLFETTVTELAKVEPRPRTMIEINAGPSRALEIFMSSAGCTYSTVDSHSQAIGTRIRAGANARRNRVAAPHDLSLLRDYHFDVAFSRSAPAWQANPDLRAQMLSEQLRIGWRSLFINLDWSVVDGGPAWTRLAEYVTGALRTMGFDPYYGATQHAEIRSQARVASRVETTRTTSFSRRFRGIVLSSARGVLSDHPMRTRTDIEGLLGDARAEMDTGHGFTLPSIVATHCY